MDEIKEYEPLDDVTVLMLKRILGGLKSSILKLDDVDLDKGCGVISDYTRCIWTRKGQRITLSVSGGGDVMGSVSHDPDPLSDPEARP
jgi:hypothetical protein